MMRKKNKLRIKIIAILGISMFFTSVIITSVRANEFFKKGYANVKTNLNIRNDPSVDSEIIGKIKPFEEIYILSEVNEKWYEIQTQNGVIGYSSKDFVVTINDIDLNKELVASAVITAKSSSKNRNYNMQRASESIDGLVLYPNDVFCWYDTKDYKGVVGPASKVNGYKVATVISGGKYVKGYGGGVCQVSTALYNCINKLGIIPIEHHHHTIQSTYVEEGMDATVSYPNKNFIFANTLDFSIKFRVYSDNGEVVVQAYKLQ